jgi:hypothetical protein
MFIQKRRMVYFGVIFTLIASISFQSFMIESVKADSSEMAGFIVEADLVEGENLTPTIIMQETSNSNSEPMLRLQFDKATIYGMRLTKQLQTKNGNVVIQMEASGPVTIEGMTVDASAISFEGVCLFAGETIPQVGMKNVSMVTHYMNAEKSNLQSLLLDTNSKQVNVERPQKSTVLKDLITLPANQLEEEIKNILDGNLPLTCENSEKEETDTGDLTDVIPGDSDDLDEIIDEVQEPLDQTKEVVDNVTEVVDDVVDDTVDLVEDTTDQLVDTTEEVVEEAEETYEEVEETVDETTDVLNEQIDNTVDDLCERVSQTTEISKELGLEIIEYAKENDLMLSEICTANDVANELIEQFEEELLKKLNPLTYLKILLNGYKEETLLEMEDLLK